MLEVTSRSNGSGASYDGLATALDLPSWNLLTGLGHPFTELEDRMRYRFVTRLRVSVIALAIVGASLSALRDRGERRDVYREQHRRI